MTDIDRYYLWNISPVIIKSVVYLKCSFKMLCGFEKVISWDIRICTPQVVLAIKLIQTVELSEQIYKSIFPPFLSIIPCSTPLIPWLNPSSWLEQQGLEVSGYIGLSACCMSHVCTCPTVLLWSMRYCMFLSVKHLSGQYTVISVMCNVSHLA